MFTGIVEETGQVADIRKSKQGIRLVVAAAKCAQRVANGDSIAVNGCCLTVVKRERKRAGDLLHFDLLIETWNRTNLKQVSPGSAVNLERSLKADGRLGGHFVTGHIDGVGKIIKWERKGADHILEIQTLPEILRYLVFKGSVAVDGISLTVAKVLKNRFRIWIIPHTFEVTALRERKVGDEVNLEADILGKYVEQFVRRHR
ncbi:riboflavin synthase [bacterium]|nr:riboflavin synthase [bacterium]